MCIVKTDSRKKTSLVPKTFQQAHMRTTCKLLVYLVTLLNINGGAIW